MHPRSATRGCPAHVREKPTIDATRGVFSRLGFDDKETACLIILGHQYGRCLPPPHVPRPVLSEHARRRQMRF